MPYSEKVNETHEVIPTGDASIEASASGTETSFVIPSGVDYCLMSIKQNDAKFTMDGTTPTSGATGVGFKFLVGDLMWFSAGSARAMQLIEARVGNPTIISIEFFERRK